MVLSLQLTEPNSMVWPRITHNAGPEAKHTAPERIADIKKRRRKAGSDGAGRVKQFVVVSPVFVIRPAKTG